MRCPFRKKDSKCALYRRNYSQRYRAYKQGTPRAYVHYMLSACRQSKREKLLQYAERIWGINEGEDDQRIDATIERTRQFFEQMQVKTHLSDYGIGKDSIPHLLDQLQAHGMVRLGEHQSVTPDVSKNILELRL